MKFFMIFPLVFFITQTIAAQPPVFLENRTGDENMIPKHPDGPLAANPHRNKGFNAIPFMDSNQIQQIMKELNIDNSRSEKILSITRSFQTFFESKIISIQREELDIKDELLKDKPDLQKIQSTIGKKSKIFAEIEFAQIKRDIDIKSILTIDEFEKWKQAIIQSMRQRPSHRMMQKGPQNDIDRRPETNVESGNQ